MGWPRAPTSVQNSQDIYILINEEPDDKGGMSQKMS